MWRSASTGAVPRARSLVTLACLLLAGCASAGTTGASTVPTGEAVDWSNRTYTVTWDGIVPDGFSATVVDGASRVPADARLPPHYDHYDVRVTGMASGDVDGDGAPDAVVLLECSPQPSNGIVQEVLVFSSTGRPLGDLPSPRTLEGDALLPPLYDPAGLSVEDGEIVAAMTAYAPGDSHASGPSVPITVCWLYDGQGFVTVAS